MEATVAQLTERVNRLLATVETLPVERERDGTGRPHGMPGLKPTNATSRPAKGARKQREQACVRRRMEPTRQMIHVLDACPQCGAPLVGGSIKRRREVIEIPVVAAVVTEHLFVERCCPHCRTRHTPTVDLAGEVVGKQRFGIGLVSLIATLCAEARLPMATIQCGCPLGGITTVHHLRISVGAIAEAIQGSPVAHMDETGWREDGVNGYAWVCATPEAVCFVRGNRGAAMVETLLGEAFGGVLVSDFYAGYSPHPGVKQKCWAHLLRDVHDLRAAHADDVGVGAWAAGVHDIYLRAVVWTREHGGASDRERQAASGQFMQELAAVVAPYREAQVPHRRLSARIAKHLHELFVFVVEPAVPPDNNQAERDLRGRPLGSMVTSRKISGGTRSPAGSDAVMTLASLFAGALWAGWRKRGENPFATCRALLLSPHP